MSILSCPLPLPVTERILLAHGGGGRLTNQLIEDIFLPAFANTALQARHDGALLAIGGTRLAMTTDTYVVQPLVFPCGTIGDLAVKGTVNDLAMCGARPIALSAGFVLEEGLAMETLHYVVNSMRDAALTASVPIVTGDTKVVDKGKGDGIFINTTGVGVVVVPNSIGPESIGSRRRCCSPQWRPWRSWNRDPVCARRPRVRRPGEQRHSLPLACSRSAPRSGY
jgi:hydrogenase expression/formation protein HypE